MEKKSYTSMLSSEPYRKYVEQLGCITANFGVLELLMLFVFDHLAGGNMNKSFVIFYSMDNRPRIDLMNALATQHWANDPDTLRLYRELVHKITDACAERNEVSHCIWAAPSRDDKTVTRLTIRTKGGTHTFKSHKETVKSLAAKAAKIAKASQAIMDFSYQAKILPSLPDILKKQLDPNPTNTERPRQR